jgi:hypothetical protein
MLFYDILCHTILYYSILCYSILYYTILCYTILCFTMLYYAILYYTTLCYTILCYTMLYYAILCYSILYFYLNLLYFTTVIQYDIPVVETQQSWRLDTLFCSLEKDAKLEDTSNSNSSSVIERAVYKGNTRTDSQDKVTAMPEVGSRIILYSIIIRRLYSIIIHRSAYNYCCLNHHWIDTSLSSNKQALPHGIVELGNSVIGIIIIISVILSSSVSS